LCSQEKKEQELAEIERELATNLGIDRDIGSEIDEEILAKPLLKNCGQSDEVGEHTFRACAFPH
jgi:hypothetical protein